MAEVRGTALSSLAALGSLVAAVSCCVPIGTFVAAAGAAGAARILAPLRPWLMALSIVLLAAGFVRTYWLPQCATRRRWFSVILLWISAAIVALMRLFPQAIAGFLADRFV